MEKEPGGGRAIKGEEILTLATLQGMEELRLLRENKINALGHGNMKENMVFNLHKHLKSIKKG